MRLSTATCRLQLDIFQGRRRASGRVSWSERRQPEVWQFGSKRLRLFTFNLTQGCFLGFSCKGLHSRCIEIKLPLQSATYDLLKMGSKESSSNSPSCLSVPEVEVAAGVCANSCPFSKSRSTRARASSLAFAISISASFLRASNLSFCRLISFFCPTTLAQPCYLCTRERKDTHEDQCTRILYRISDLHYTPKAPVLGSNTTNKRQSGA